MVESFGPYVLLKQIATGGMAEVHLARPADLQLASIGDLLVVKRMLPQLAVRPDFVQMFLDEGRLTATLRHPHIVAVHDIGTDGETPYIALELVDGPHLGSLFAHSLRARRPLPLDLCCFVVACAAAGLHHAHAQVDPETGRPLELVHRDISPQNILVGRTGDVKVTDFGVAKATTQQTKTRTGVIKGKVAYMAPEQCLGDTIDRRTDVFALGIVLYELLTRRRLFRDKSDLLIMQRITGQDVPAPSTVNPAVNADLDVILRCALARNVEERYASAEELADALEGWLALHGSANRTLLERWFAGHCPELAPSSQLSAEELGGKAEHTVAVRHPLSTAVMSDASSREGGFERGATAATPSVEGGGGGAATSAEDTAAPAPRGASGVPGAPPNSTGLPAADLLDALEEDDTASTRAPEPPGGRGATLSSSRSVAAATIELAPVSAESAAGVAPGLDAEDAALRTDNWATVIDPGAGGGSVPDAGPPGALAAGATLVMAPPSPQALSPLPSAAKIGGGARRSSVAVGLAAAAALLMAVGLFFVVRSGGLGDGDRPVTGDPPPGSEPAPPLEPAPEPSAALGSVRVETVPTGVLVFAAGREVGRSPVAFDAPLGTIELEAAFADQPPRRTTITVTDETLTTVKLVALVPVHVTTSPPRAQVWLAGTLRGEAPLQPAGLVEPGEPVTVRAVLDGHAPHEETVTPGCCAPVKLAVSLVPLAPAEPTPSPTASPTASPTRPPAPAPTRTPQASSPPRDEGTGALSVRTVPWTTARLGNEVLGDTPFLQRKVKAGKQQLVLRNPQLGIDETLTITVPKDKTLVVDLKLEKGARGWKITSKSIR